MCHLKFLQRAGWFLKPHLVSRRLSYRTNYYLLCHLLVGFAFVSTSQAEKVIVGDFTNSNISGWEEKVFEGETSYKLSEIPGIISLKAQSNNSASSLVKKTNIDLI